MSGANVSPRGCSHQVMSGANASPTGCSHQVMGARMNLTLHYSERVYNALLSLYPFRFRIRFAAEMLQLFRDCCHDALEKGEVAVLAAFWLRAMRDLFLSLIRERQREVLGPLDSEHP